MKDFACKLSANLQALIWSEEGQDLVEYALLISLVSLAAIAALNTIAADIVGLFNTVSAQVSSAAA